VTDGAAMGAASTFHPGVPGDAGRLAGRQVTGVKFLTCCGAVMSGEKNEVVEELIRSGAVPSRPDPRNTLSDRPVDLGVIPGEDKTVKPVLIEMDFLKPISRPRTWQEIKDYEIAGLHLPLPESILSGVSTVPTTHDESGETITPLEDRVVILPDQAETQTKGGILIPDTAKERPQRGTVVAVGPGRRVELTGVIVPMSLSIGDRVLFEHYAGVTITSGGVDYRIVTEKQIAAKIG
jgi:chaperonin GroES